MALKYWQTKNRNHDWWRQSSAPRRVAAMPPLSFLRHVQVVGPHAAWWNAHTSHANISSNIWASNIRKRNEMRSFITFVFLNVRLFCFFCRAREKWRNSRNVGFYRFIIRCTRICGIYDTTVSFMDKCQKCWLARAGDYGYVQLKRVYAKFSRQCETGSDNDLTDQLDSFFDKKAV